MLAGGDVELAKGLNVLTGETGAGKSLVVDSLALLAGARAASDADPRGRRRRSPSPASSSRDRERRRAARARRGLEADGDELVVRREIGREGQEPGLRRRPAGDAPAAAGARAAPAAHPRPARRARRWSSPGLQRRWLDRAGGGEGEALLARVEVAYAATSRPRRAAGALARRRAASAPERIDLLRFQARRDRRRAAASPARRRTLRRDARPAAPSRGDRRAPWARPSRALYEDDGAVVRAARRSAAPSWRRSPPGSRPPPRRCAELDELRSRAAEELARALASPARRRRRRRARAARRGRGAAGAARAAASASTAARAAELLARRDRMRGASSRELDASDEDRAALERRHGARARGATAPRRWSSSRGARAVGEASSRRGCRRELADLALGRRALRGRPRARAGAPGARSSSTARRSSSAPHGFDQVVFRLRAQPGRAAAAAGAHRLGRRAVARLAGAPARGARRRGRRRSRRWSSTRSTPASAAPRGRRSARSCGGSRGAARSSPSPTCRRWRASPTPPPGRARRCAAAAPSPRSKRSTRAGPRRGGGAHALRREGDRGCRSRTPRRCVAGRPSGSGDDERRRAARPGLDVSRRPGDRRRRARRGASSPFRPSRATASASIRATPPASKRSFRFKGRERGKALPVVVASADAFHGLGVDRGSLRCYGLRRAGRPRSPSSLPICAGRCRPRRGERSLAVVSGARRRCARSSRRSDRPLTATSANPSGEPADARSRRRPRLARSGTDSTRRGGRRTSAGGPPSTLVELVGGVPKVLRQGSYLSRLANDPSRQAVGGVAALLACGLGVGFGRWRSPADVEPPSLPVGEVQAGQHGYGDLGLRRQRAASGSRSRCSA